MRYNAIYLALFPCRACSRSWRERPFGSKYLISNVIFGSFCYERTFKSPYCCCGSCSQEHVFQLFNDPGIPWLPFSPMTPGNPGEPSFPFGPLSPLSPGAPEVPFLPERPGCPLLPEKPELKMKTAWFRPVQLESISVKLLLGNGKIKQVRMKYLVLLYFLFAHKLECDLRCSWIP